MSTNMAAANAMDDAARRMSRVAFLQSRIARMNAELEGMVAENKIRESEGKALAFGYDAFMALIDRYDMGHNAVIVGLR